MEIKQKVCPYCNKYIEKLRFTSQMTEEWTWNGLRWECTARHTLIEDNHMPVRCAECDNVIGKGTDFGF